MSTSHWKVAAGVAERQHLIVAVWQLKLLGLSDRAIADRITKGGWRRVSPGVIALPGTMTAIRRLAASVLAYSSPTGAAQRVEQAIASTGSEVEALVAAAMGSGQVVCGRSALWLHGVADAPGHQWIRLPAKTGHAERPGVRLRYGTMTGGVAAREGLPVVDVVQAFKDVAGCRKTRSLRLHHELARGMATADALRLLTLDGVEARLEADPRFVGAPRLRRVVTDLRGELSHSATERAARRIVGGVLDRYDLQLHPRPYAILLGDRLVGEADLPILAIKLDLEIDGPHHLLPRQRQADQVRDRWVRRASWEVERFGTDLVDLHPEKFAAAVDECVRARLSR